MQGMQCNTLTVNYILTGSVNIVSSRPESCKARESFGFEKLRREGVVGYIGFVVAFGEGKLGGRGVRQEGAFETYGLSVGMVFIELRETRVRKSEKRLCRVISKQNTLSKKPFELVESSTHRHTLRSNFYGALSRHFYFS